MEKAESLKIANINIAYLQRRVDELEKLLLNSDTERSKWMKKYQKAQFSITDHKSIVWNFMDQLPRGVVNANNGLWEILNDKDR
jgi:hypothetical protein